METCNLCGRNTQPSQPSYEQEAGDNSCPEHGHLSEMRLDLVEVGELVEHLQLKSRTIQLREDPISQLLPPEVVSQIFERYCVHDLPTISEKYVPQKYSPLRLGSICRAWRQIAWSTPRLWTCLEINFDSSLFMSSEGYEIARDWLGRTGSLQLQIRVSREYPCRFEDEVWITETRKVTDLLNEYSPRWEFLDLWVPVDLLRRFSQALPNGCQPRLSTLRVETPDDDISSTPELYTMRMPNLCPNQIKIKYIQYNILDIGWTNLTTLVASDIYSEDALKIIASAPQLLSCSLCDLRQSDNLDLPLDYLHISHPRLLSLTFRFAFFGGCDFFRHVSLPALTSLNVELWDHCDSIVIPRIVDLIHISSAQLTKLVLTAPEHPLAEISGLLHEVPSLEDLLLSRPFETKIWKELFNSIGRSAIPYSSSTIFLPNLQHLVFEHPADAGPTPEEWDFILDALQAAILDCDAHFCSNAKFITILYNIERSDIDLDMVGITFKVKHIVGLANIILAGIPLQFGLGPNPNGKIKYLDLIQIRKEIDTRDPERYHRINWYTSSTTKLYYV